MRPKGGKGQIISPRPGGSQTTSGTTSAIFSPKFHSTQNGHKRPSEPQMAKTSIDNIFHAGEDFPFFNALRTQEPGVVHIWYDIPLCTIFAHQSNGDTFRTQLRDSKSSLKSITNFEGRPFHYSVWQFPGGYQKTIEGPQPPGPAGVGLSILTKTILRPILRGNQLLHSFSRHQVISIPCTTQLVHTGSNQAAVWPWPNWANSYSPVGIQSHSSTLKMARTVLAQFRQYSPVIHLPGSALQLFTYTDHVSSLVDFFPS
ncbi:hypothetical protein O181_021345 [Austropuccinia psidii MF-1]|uniref:Uncharacterized protein n=1 Tax=Austropuccinia psidii MF-1 TaxID=1389203 RepID=A0A9Q3GX10_9BASI|nr:hypothetical protein [Austropuccinia psidii MF-1]